MFRVKLLDELASLAPIENVVSIANVEYGSRSFGT